MEFGVTLIGDGKVISFGVFKVPTYYSYNKVLRSHASSPRIGACGDEDLGFHSLNLDMSDLKLGPL